LSKVVHSFLPVIIITVPWLAIAGALLWGTNRPRAAKVVYVGCTAVTFLLITTMYPRAMDGVVSVQHIVEVAPRISLAFRVDTLGFYFALLLSLLWLLTTVYSLGYIHTRETRYYCFVAINLSFCLGVAFAANMFTLFIFYELLSLCTYPLIIHDETEMARRAGLKYLVYSISAAR